MLEGIGFEAQVTLKVTVAVLRGLGRWCQGLTRFGIGWVVSLCGRVAGLLVTVGSWRGGGGSAMISQGTTATSRTLVTIARR